MGHAARGDAPTDLDGVNENHEFHLRIKFLNVSAVAAKIRLQAGRAKAAKLRFSLELPLTLFLVLLQIHVGPYYSLVFNRSLLSSMNFLISSVMAKSFNHCSLYKVTGKRPIP